MEFLSNEEDNLWVASSDGNLQRIKQLIESGQYNVNDQDENGYSALHAAVSYGQIEVLDFLLSIGGNIRLKDNDGDEPIHYCEDPEVFEYLIDHGSDPTVLNNNGEDLFHKVIEDENGEMVNYLISKGLGQATESLPQFEFTDTFIEEDDEDKDNDS